MRIAIAQTPGARLDRWRDTLDLLRALVAQAADERAELVVLPECAWPAYCLGSIGAYRAARAAGMPGPPWLLASIGELAAAKRIAICAGFVNETADRITNAACLIDNAGCLLGVREKCFLWAFDHDYFAPGERIQPIDTQFGRVGLMVCADARLPEIAATLAHAGVDIILQPTAWVDASGDGSRWNPQADFLIRSRATEFGTPIVSASKWGAEQETAFVGSSLVCDANGGVLVQCPREGTLLRVADVILEAARAPVVSDAERAVLLSAVAPATPNAEAGALTLVPLPPGSTAQTAHSRAGLTGQRTPLLAFCPHAEGRGGWVAHAGGRIGCPTTTCATASGATLGVLDGEAVARFAPARCLALRGAHVVFVFGDAPAMHLQARACENRVYVVHADRTGWTVYDPRGLPAHCGVWSGGPPSDAAVLDLAAAADKCVAPGTDVLAGRNVRLFRF